MIILDKPSTNFRCFFVVKTDAASVKYRIDNIVNTAHPFQLLKRVSHTWESLSVYVSIEDCVGVLLKDLFSVELQDEINHGQATMDSSPILSRILVGERRIVIDHTSVTRHFRSQRNICFENLIIRPTITSIP